MKFSGLEKNEISIADIKEAATACERSGDKMQDTATGLFVCSRRVGAITLWVEYRIGEGCAHDVPDVVNAYYNRTKPIGPVGPASMQDVSANPAYITLAERDMLCCKCGVAPEIMRTAFRYLKFDYVGLGLICPRCGLVYLTEGVVDLQRNTIERILESK